jgi:toxin YxiD
MAAAALFALPACQRPPEDRTRTGSAEQSRSGIGHDLSLDESEGGHTLQRHVARTDEELRQRLQSEPNISAASTYTDRAAAESTVGAALAQQRPRIERWLQRGGGHPNLVLDFNGDPQHPIGRTLRRASNTTEPCAHAVVILKWDGDGDYHVLTSYPECK